MIVPKAQNASLGTSVSVSSVVLAGDYSGPPQTGDWNPYPDTHESQQVLGPDTGTLTNGGLFTFPSPVTFTNTDINNPVTYEVSFLYFQPPAFPFNDQVSIDASRAARGRQPANPIGLRSVQRAKAGDVPQRPTV